MSAGWRCSLAVFAALAATAVALILHARAGGDGSVLAIAVSLVGVTWMAVLLAGRTLGVLPLALLAGGAQVYVHGVMSVLGRWQIRLDGTGVLSLTIGAHPSPSAAVMPAGMTGSGTSDVASGIYGMTGMTGMAAGHMPGAAMFSPHMLAAHSLALVLTVAALRWGESVLTTVAGVLSRAVLGMVRFVAQLPPVHGSPIPASQRAAFVPRRADITPRVLRGPPLPVV